MQRKSKRSLTLLEIMIVIFLITLITGVIGYNMKGSMDKGKAFRTVQAQEQLHDLLIMALSEGETQAKILENPSAALKKVGIAKDPAKLLKDGWGDLFEIEAKTKSDFKIKSTNLITYKQKLNKINKQEADSPEDEEN
jgi:type II secretory pathway pseudopilin PulG